MKSGALWVHCRGLAVAEFGRNPRMQQLESQAKFCFFFVRYKATHNFVDFPSAKFHERWTQHVDLRRNENFRNRILNILP